ncbi:MAG TPA: ROK family transcriptional regulator [Luteimicrobium sp.]|nr:ROK family transcriptional regulator [Luteimicrobium sp.]
MTAEQTTARRGTNLPRMGDFNESVVLDAIRRAPEGLSRVELAGATRLSAQTVSNICRRLIQGGLVREAGKKSGLGGKPRIVLQVEPSARYAVGVHLDPAVVTYVVLDLVGSVVHRMRRPTPQVADEVATLDEMAAALAQVLEESGVDRSKVLGLGIAAPGPLDLAAGAIVRPPQLQGWERVHVRDRLAEATGLPVVMDKDVIAAAIAERWAGVAQHSGNFLFFYIGTGSGMGLVVEDVVVRGFSGNAGEIGGLDASLTTRALVAEAIERGVLEAGDAPVGPRDAEVQAARLAELAHGGDEAAIGIIDGWARRVGRGVCAAATLVDSELIVFGGPVWPIVRERFLEVVPEIVSTWPYRALHDFEVVGSGLGDDVGAVGAACLVLDQTLSAQPQALLVR